MSRKFFGVEKGVDIFTEAGDVQVRILTGTAAPDGLGDQLSAPIGSIYARSGVGELYQKIANVGAASDWEQNRPEATIGTWRPENVRLVTNDTQGAGVRDVVANPFSDDSAPATPVGFYTVGNYIISDADGTPALLEITNVSGDDVTFAVAENPLVEQDTFITKLYLPDDPNDQELQAIVNYTGSIIVKVADLNWEFATGINLSSAYGAVNGSITTADTVETALEKLDGNQQDIQTLQGVSQGSTTLGTFTGSTIPDAQNIKGALQSLETAHEETDTNVDDLITLSGVAENSTDNGAMDQGTVLSDDATTNALFKEVDKELTRINGSTSATAITTATVVDSVLVDEVANGNWQVCIEKTAVPAAKRHFVLFAGHNGHAAADATLVDDVVSKILKLGANFNYSITVALSGTGATQKMEVSVASTEPGGVNVYMKRSEDLF